MTFSPTLSAAAAASALTLLAGCSTTASPPAMFNQSSLPEAVRVPAGHRIAMETVGVGEITYECRARKDSAGQFEWVFVGPEARLLSRTGQPVGRYFGPPATWESNDGSRLTATQLAVAPSGSANLPLQLVRANPAMGMGALQGISHIQRVATVGGVAPAAACGEANQSARQTVKYQADYIFWKAV